jgi:hydrogenase maturation factor
VANVFRLIGPVTTNIRHDKLYPAVGLKKGNDTARVNFGQTEFVFDIDTFVQVRFAT